MKDKNMWDKLLPEIEDVIHRLLSVHGTMEKMSKTRDTKADIMYCVSSLASSVISIIGMYYLIKIKNKMYKRDYEVLDTNDKESLIIGDHVTWDDYSELSLRYVPIRKEIFDTAKMLTDMGIAKKISRTQRQYALYHVGNKLYCGDRLALKFHGRYGDVLVKLQQNKERIPAGVRITVYDNYIYVDMPKGEYQSVRYSPNKRYDILNLKRK